MRVKLTDIERDTSIQCRASIDVETVNDYATHMTEGATFPAVELFTDGKRFWIGDGWHRVMASEQIGATDIEANVKDGGRISALKCALGTNAVHGLRRSNDDKERCVKIALREFGGMSSRVISEMCGVGHTFVDSIRNKAVASDATPQKTRTDSIGRQQPAGKPTAAKPAEVKQRAIEDEESAYEPAVKVAVDPVSNSKRGVGVELSNNAIAILQRIPIDDPLRQVGMQTVIQWIKANK